MTKKSIIQYILIFIEYLVFYPCIFYIIGMIISILKIPSPASFYFNNDYYKGDSALGISLGLIFFNYFSFILTFSLILGIFVKNTLSNIILHISFDETNSSKIKRFFYTIAQCYVFFGSVFFTIFIFQTDYIIVNLLGLVSVLLIILDLIIRVTSKGKKDLILNISKLTYRN